MAEVVSSNWQNDYARKVEDYAALGIPEYWIADYAGLGGIRHIGKSKQPTLSICTLVNGEYEMQQLRGNQCVVSPTFPSLKLTAEQVLRTVEFRNRHKRAERSYRKKSEAECLYQIHKVVLHIKDPPKSPSGDFE